MSSQIITIDKNIITISGTAAASGNNQIIAAGSSRIKVCAYSLTTASTTAMTCLFQSGASGTEIWSVLLQAITGSTTGANLAVPAPAWIFATSTATSLNLNLSSANTIRYSISYFIEG